MRLSEISINKQIGFGITTLMQLTGFVCLTIAAEQHQQIAETLHISKLFL